MQIRYRRERIVSGFGFSNFEVTNHGAMFTEHLTRQLSSVKSRVRESNVKVAANRVARISTHYYKDSPNLLNRKHTPVTN